MCDERKDARLVTLTEAIRSDWYQATLILAELRDLDESEDGMTTEIEAKMGELTSALANARELALATLGVAAIDRSYLAG